MKNLQNKVVVITGAASGIGKALAMTCLAKGCHLVLNDYDEKGLKMAVSQMQSTTNQRIEWMAFDVSDKLAMERFAQFTIDKFGQVDLVINNAGVALGRLTIESASYDELEWVMNINYWGMVYGSKTFLPLLKTRPEAALVNISSVFGLAGMAYQGGYCSSKFAIRGFTEALRMEAMMLFPHVTIHSVHPGGIATNIAKNARWNEQTQEDKAIAEFFDEQNLVSPPMTAAKGIINGIQKKKSRVLVGYRANLLDRLVRFFPSFYSKLVKVIMEREEAEARKIG